MKTLVLVLLGCVALYLATVGAITGWMYISLKRQGVWPWSKEER